MAINDQIVAVGAPFDDDHGASSGAVYLFNATTGQQLAKITAGDGQAGARFGDAVDMSLAADQWALATLREEARGKMVIDCGATRSLGSILALEDFAAINRKKTAPAEITVDPNENTTLL